MSCRLFGIVLFALGAIMSLPGSASAAGEPSVSMTIKAITPTKDGVVVTGTVTCKGPKNEGGARHYYRVSVIAEIKDGPDSKFPKLVKGLIICPPQGAETSYTPGSGTGRTMTREEYHGKNITTVKLGGCAALGTYDFEGRIPAKHAGKPMRIRAKLNYQFNHVNAAWPMIKFYHGKGTSGTVPKPASGKTATGSNEGSNTPDGQNSSDPDKNPDNQDRPQDAQDTSDPKQTSQDPTGKDQADSKPVDLIGSLGLDMKKGKYAGELGWAGDVEHQPLKDSDGVVTTPGKIPEDILLQMIAEDFKKFMSSKRINPEDRPDMASSYGDLVQSIGEVQQQQIWQNYKADTVFTASDLTLSYIPLTAPVWTTGKIAVDLAEGEYWQAALNATTLLGNVKVPGKAHVITNTGQKIQLATDYYKIGYKVGQQLPEPSKTSNPSKKSPSGMWTNWGTKSTPGMPEPVLWGNLR